MKDKEEEYREFFQAEARENFEEISRILTQLEKKPKNKSNIHELFRITHTLKGNASGLGFTAIAELSHVMEDLFGEVRDGNFVLTDEVFSALFVAVDLIGSLVNNLGNEGDIKYKGTKTKLSLLLKKGKAEQQAMPEEFAHINIESEADVAPDKAVIETSSTLNKEQAADEKAEPNTVINEADNKIAFSDLVQVPVRKLDDLLNLVGELLIEKDRILASQRDNGSKNSNEFSRLSRISNDLQYSVMNVRMVQVGFLFNKFHRVVRDAAAGEKKNAVLNLEGAETEIDRNVLQVISDSLIHLIRNAVGHGIESPEQRKQAGKSKEGTIWLSAQNGTESVIIEIRDDGAGLDHEKIRQKAVAKGLLTPESAEQLSDEALGMIIFEPGFSTQDQITSISGRGVGMDVVKRTVESIGGTVKLFSEKGKGTTISLAVPASMAVKSCLLLELKQDVYAIPLSFTESVISLYKPDIIKAGGGLIANHLGKSMAIVFLNDVFGFQESDSFNSNIFQKTYDQLQPEKKLEVVVVTYGNRRVGFVVDKLLQQKEIIEKPLMKPVDTIKFVSGVTILGSGNVCLVINVPFILNYIFNMSFVNKPVKV